MDTKTFQLDQAQLDRFADKLKTIPWKLSDSTLRAEVKVRGVKLALAYDPSSHTLTVQILHRPIFPIPISEDRVWHELDNYLQDKQGTQ
jgi:hypothetical protein